MAMVTLKSTSKANLSQTFPFENSNNNRDASFSSYLNSNEETFVRKLADQASEGVKSNHLGTKKEEDEEIGVFGAEKYFNGVMDEETSSKSSSSTKKYHNSKENRVCLDHMKINVQPGTPSVRSESSWNSQSALLRSGSRNPNRSKTSKANRQRKNFFASLGCKCSCSDKSSVDVDEHVGEISFKKNNGANCGMAIHGKASTTPLINNKPASIDLVGEALVELKNNQKLEKVGAGLSRENCFTFPTSKTAVGSLSLPVQMPFQEEEEKVRKSLEVFGSPVFGKRNKSLGLDKRRTMLPWDEFPANSGGVINHNESDSDASSDLFEIESLTGKVSPFLARQASDATSGCVTPTNCYAPSEASIEWSVVTASVADFSAMSDFEDHQRPTPMKMVPNNNKHAKTRMNKEQLPIRNHRAGVLLGCKSQKSVEVAGDAHRTYHEKTNFDQQVQMMHRRPESFMPGTRFQAETTKLTGFDSRLQGQHALPPSHSPRASNLLFMQ